MKLSKKMKTALDFVGEDYKVKEIDLELCLYRDLHTGYDIEVSGIDLNRKGYVCSFIQVWDIRVDPNYGAKTVEKVREIKTLQELKTVLEQLSEKYGKSEVKD